MRFMIIRKADAETEAGVMPSEQLITEMMKYNEEMVRAGVMLAGDGLHPSAKGLRVKFSGGKPTLIDGPFAETKELIAGFTMIQVKSREEAIEWVKRWPAIDGHGAAELELRQVAEAEDFGDAFTPELREQEDLLRAEVEQQAKQR
ncbi:MAG: YciI family protein [Burkholderiaceae bacterium]|nr:YciI family protein [Burkholderiaceae bacterium]MBT9504906.1 YciI family protein [Burkholderiaceae bacterium]